MRVKQHSSRKLVILTNGMPWDFEDALKVAARMAEDENVEIAATNEGEKIVQLAANKGAFRPGDLNELYQKCKNGREARAEDYGEHYRQQA